MKNTLFILCMLLVIFLSACEGVDVSQLSDNDLDRIAERAIVCNEPYIRLGTGCCLDENNNNICDEDENIKIQNEDNNNGIYVENNYEDTIYVNNDKEENEKYSFNFKTTHTIGENSAPVTLIMWNDLTERFGKNFYDETLDLIVEEYVDEGKVKIIYKHFPLGFHKNAQKAAEAAECAAEQDEGLFWNMYIWFEEQDEEVSLSDIRLHAKGNVKDYGKFVFCLDNGVAANKVLTEIKLGKSIGVQGIPAFFINGKHISGNQPYEVFKKTIDEELSSEESQNDETILTHKKHIIGNPKAPVTIVQWGDLDETFTKRFYDTTYEEILMNYILKDEVNLQFKHFPLGFHEHAQKAAEATECAAQQNEEMFWEMYVSIIEQGVGNGENTFKQYASELKLDTDKFDKCIDSGATAAIVKADIAEGKDKGVNGIPTFFINGEEINGAQPYTVFQESIDKALN